MNLTTSPVMRRLLLTGALMLMVWTPAFSASPPAAPSFGEAVEVNVVNVDVYATDKNGHRINGLGKGDFELLEDGKRVAISNFEVVVASAPQAGGVPAGSAPPGAAVTLEDPLNLVVYFDDFNIRPPHRTRVLKQLTEFLAHQLAPGDRVMLVTEDLGLNVRVPFTSDPAAVAKGLREIGTLAAHGDESDRDRAQAFRSIMTLEQASLADPVDPVPCPQNIVTPAHSYAASRRNEVLRTISSLTVLVNSLSGVPGRKALLHVSDGLPLNPGEELFQLLLELCGGLGNSGLVKVGADPSDPNVPYDARSIGPQAYQAASQAMLDAQTYSVAKNLQALAAHANAQRVTLYTLQASGLQGTAAADASFGPEERLLQSPSIGTSLRTNHQGSLQLLADETGGRAILDANNVLPDLSRMREDFSSFYSLGFTPAHASDGREHKIEVRARRPGVRLRYRQSYRDKPAFEKVVDRTLAALYYDMEDNPLAIEVEIGDQTPAEGGQYAVPVRLKIPLFKLAILNREETFQGKLRLLVATRDAAGGTSPMRQVEVPLNIPRKEVLNALGQYYIYTLTLKMKPGVQHVAVAVRDEIAATTSYLSRPVTVGAAEASR
ncbi:MAG TPA: VWA domain-containing protein [Thermoanaerobaculia bacterium]|nr:VWA domain-containing protein [Thermoanaerobaculia bacterium]